MKYQIIPVIILALITMLIYMFVPTVIFFIGLIGAVLASIILIMAFKVLSKRMFPTVVRIWEQRANGFTIVENTRGKRIKQGGVEKYELISGKKIKSPSKSFIIKGDNDSFIDIFTPDGINYFPMNFNRIDVGKISVLDEDSREWLAHEIVRNKEITKPPMTRLQEFMPILVIATTGIVLMVMIVAFMQYFPEFVAKMTQTMTSQINVMSNITDRLIQAAGIINQSGQIPPEWALGG